MTVYRLFTLSFLMLVFVHNTCRSDDKQTSAKYPFNVVVSGKGPSIIFIPGLACSGAVWDDAVEHFKSRYECHVLTLAGFAGVPPKEQDKPFLDTVRTGIVQYIRDKKLSRPVVVGHSIGGFLAYELGIHAADDVGPLVAVDGLPFLPALVNEKVTEEQSKKMAELSAKRLAELPKDAYIRQQQATLAMWIDDKTKRERPLKWGTDSDQATVSKAMSEMSGRDLRKKVEAIKSPVLVVAAPVAFGAITKDEARKRYNSQVELIPNKTVAIAEKSKHFVMFDEPEWLWKQIDDFLKKAEK